MSEVENLSIYTALRGKSCYARAVSATITGLLLADVPPGTPTIAFSFASWPLATILLDQLGRSMNAMRNQKANGQILFVLLLVAWTCVAAAIWIVALWGIPQR